MTFLVKFLHNQTDNLTILSCECIQEILLELGSDLNYEG